MKKNAFAILVSVSLIFLTAGVYARPDSSADVIVITKAQWNGDNQRLEIQAKAPRRKQSLTVLYSDSTYPMKYDRRRRQFVLKVDSVCYDELVTVESSSGLSATDEVKDIKGNSSGKECGEKECPDADGDGFADALCGGTDCDDANASIHPGGEDICGDGIDQNCSGQADENCNGGPHSNLSYSDYPNNCLSCHEDKAKEVSQSTHYRWLGDTPDMVNRTGEQQGKLTNAVNSYCISILGDWPVCGTCHAGRGKRPDDVTAGLSNIDCLVCHNADYALNRTRLADGSMGVSTSSDSMVRDISKPARTNCLKCHANAGGGDGVKRGDLSMALIANADSGFDVHMNDGSGNLSCQDCHTFQDHRVIGKGSDLRPTDDVQRGARIDCAKCHEGKNSSSGHENEFINKHVGRVACQTCHIPTYAKTPTETHREWRLHADGSPADGVSGPGHPYTVKESSLVPEYKFWNGKSDNTLLGDDASKTFDPEFSSYPTSRPAGDINDNQSRLYPFKYKTAAQPKTTGDDRLIALDTFEYLKATGDVASAIKKGLVNMGYPAEEPYEWIVTDTYQLLNHGVNPASGALSCNQCHFNTDRIDLQGELGYAVKASTASLCVQCHDRKEKKPFEEIHKKHVWDKKYDCSWCHNFSRPEKGLRTP